MKPVIKYLLILIALAAVVFVFIHIISLFKGCSSEDHANESTITIIDSTLKYRTITKHDTVIRFIDRIVWKQAKPEIVYKQKVDSQYFETIKYMDFMLKVDKKGRNLSVFAINLQDSILKERHYIVGDDFTVSSKANNLFVKTRRLTFESPYIELNRQQPIREGTKLLDGGFELAIGTDGLNYMNKLNIGGRLNYNNEMTENRLVAELYVRYFPFR